jgi:hypothetical protein
MTNIKTDDETFTLGGGLFPTSFTFQRNGADNHFKGLLWELINREDGTDIGERLDHELGRQFQELLSEPATLKAWAEEELNRMQSDIEEVLNCIRSDFLHRRAILEDTVNKVLAEGPAFLLRAEENRKALEAELERAQAEWEAKQAKKVFRKLA